MKIAVIGAGAIGCLMAAKMHQAHHDVTLVARGETGHTVRRHGIRIVSPEGTSHAFPPVVMDTAELSWADVVFIAVKGHSIPGIVDQLAPLVGPHTLVVSALNGIPWWFGAALPGAFAGYCPPAIAQHAVVSAIVPIERTVGCVVFPCSNRIGPGVFNHLFGDRLILGFPVRPERSGLEPIVGVLNSAGFGASISRSIGTEVWSKLIGNLAHNPVSALTGATCDVMLENGYLRSFCAALMHEANDVGTRLGFKAEPDIDGRNHAVASSGPFKTSMLQDVERGTELELDSLVYAVKDLAAHAGVATPVLDSLVGLLQVSSRAGRLPRSSALQ